MPGAEGSETVCEPMEDAMTLYGEPSAFTGDPMAFMGDGSAREAFAGASR